MNTHDNVTISKSELESEIAAAVEHAIAGHETPEVEAPAEEPAPVVPEPEPEAPIEAAPAAFTRNGLTVTRHHPDGDAVINFSDESAAAEYVASL